MAQTLNKYDKFLIILLASLMFGSIGGALTIPRVVAILLFPYLAKGMRACGYYISRYKTFFTVFICWCVLSMVWTTDKMQGFKELCYHTVHFVYFFEILVFSKFANRPLQSIIFGWILSATVSAAIGLWEVTTGNHLSFVASFQDEKTSWNIGGGMTLDQNFARAAYGNYNSFVAYICFAFAFLLYSVFQKGQNTLVRVVSIGVSVALVSIVILNASRGGLLTIIVFFAVFILSKFKPKYTIPFAIVAIALYLLIANILDNPIFELISYRVSDGGLLNGSDRFEIWDCAWETYVRSAFIGTGVGSITASMLITNPNIIASPHNLFLEILVQYGFIFLFCYLSFLLGIFKKTLRVADRQRKVMLLACFIAMPFFSIIDSGYLLTPNLYAFCASIYVFANIELINKQLQSS